MGDPFICNKCGAPRKYINQFCPECFSTGPHLEAPRDKKSRGGAPVFRKKPPANDSFAGDFEPRKHGTKDRKHNDNSSFDEEFQLYRPRQEKINTTKEPKPVKAPRPKPERPPRVEKRSESAEDNESIAEKKSFGFPVSGRTVLYLTFFVLLTVLIVLLVVNGLNSGTVDRPGQPDTVAANQKPATPDGNNPAGNVSSNNTTPNSPQNIPADNSSKPVVVTPATPKDTAIPKLAGEGKAEIIAADTSVTIAWKTDEQCKSIVKYGTTTSCDYFSPDEPGYKTEHSMFLSNLIPDTLYYYKISATDQAGNSGPVTDGSFRTDYQSNTAPYVGSRAPDFTLKTLEGKQVSLSQYRGRKVVLNFWASWCTPCKIELPHLQEIWAKYKDGDEITVLTVAGSESDEDEVRSYISTRGFTFPVCLDSTESTFNRYDLTSIPKTYFIDQNGVIKKVQLGMFTSPGEIDFILSSY